jgi:hypothetical protein
LPTKTGLLAAVLALAACAPAPPPDLSGVWKMNPARSRLARGAAVPALWIDTVEHRGPELRIASRRRSPDSFFTASYTIGGGEACNVIDDRMACSRARWDGVMLRIDSTVSEDQGELKWSERWSLAPDRRTLTVDRRGSLPRFVFYERQ